jgi:hypothetical protein
MKMTFSLVKENLLSKGKRILKVLQYGAKTASVTGPYGDDSSPLKDMIAIYAPTDESGDAVIMGYINKHQISKPGEKRIFSENPDGSLSCSIHLKANGICEIGEASDFAVRHTPLDTGLQNQNALINAEFAKVALAINAIVPGSYSPGTINIDISNAKIEKTKI